MGRRSAVWLALLLTGVCFGCDDASPPPPIVSRLVGDGGPAEPVDMICYDGLPFAPGEVGFWDRSYSVRARKVEAWLSGQLRAGGVRVVEKFQDHDDGGWKVTRACVYRKRGV